MQAGYYLLIDGHSLKIQRVNDRFVYLRTGARITREYAEQFKCSSEHVNSVMVKSRRVGQTLKAKQLGLL